MSCLPLDYCVTEINSYVSRGKKNSFTIFYYYLSNIRCNMFFLVSVVFPECSVVSTKKIHIRLVDCHVTLKMVSVFLPDILITLMNALMYEYDLQKEMSNMWIFDRK